MGTTTRYRAELLPNGLVSVYDYQCQWSCLYGWDESRAAWRYRGGCASDSPCTRAAVAALTGERVSS